MKMKLESFIKAMKEGWGFRSPHRVMDIGSALESLFADAEEDLLEKEVEVEHVIADSGRGPDSRTLYRWSVRGVDAPITRGKIAPDELDRIFGYTAETLPYLYAEEGGFSVSYIT